MIRTPLARLLLVNCLLALPSVPVWADAPDRERKDADGTPLPFGALARLGSARYRLPVSPATARLSPDGKYVAVGGGNPQVFLLDVKTGKEVRRLTTTAGTNFLLYSPTGKTLASTWYDGIIRFWDVNTGAEVRRVTTGKIRANAFTLSGDGKLLAVSPQVWNQKGTAHVFDATTGKEVCHVEALQTTNVSIALNGDGKLLATWGGTWFGGRERDREKQERITRTVQLWNTGTGKEVRQVVSRNGSVAGAALSPDGKTLVVATHTFAIQFWDTATGKMLRSMQARRNVGQTLVFSPDGKRLVATGSAGKLQGWDVATGNRLRLRAGPPCLLHSLAFPADGRVLACGIDGQTLVVWDALSGKVYSTNDGHHNNVGALGFSADGKHLLSAGIDGMVLRWDAVTGKQVGAVEDDQDDNYRRMGGRGAREALLLFAPGGKYLVCGGSTSPGYRVREMATGQELFACIVNAGFGTHAGATFSPDGKLLAAVRMDWKTKKSSVQFWKVPSGQELPDLEGMDGQIVSLAFAPDNKSLAVGTQATAGAFVARNNFVLRLWDLTTRKQIKSFQEFQGQGYAARPITFSPDGKWLAVPNPTGTVSLLDALTGIEARVLPGDGYLQTPVVFSPDSRTLAAGIRRNTGNEAVVRVWETVSGKVRRTLAAGRDFPTAIAFAPDGKRLATGCADTTILLWDVSGRLLARAPAKARLDDKALERLWSDLGAGAPEGFEAMLELAAAPDDAVPLLAKRVKPAARKALDAKAVEKLIAQLDDDDFTVREEAGNRLGEVGRSAVPALRKALAAKPSVEAKRRIEQLLEKLSKPGAANELVRPFRVMETLEWIATPQAIKVLQTLAEGDPGAEVTQQASAALRRLGAPVSHKP